MKLTDTDYLDYTCPLHVLNTDGFTNLKKNVLLLKKYGGDPERVRRHLEIDSELQHLKTQKRALLYKDQLEADQQLQDLAVQLGLERVIKALHRFQGDAARTTRHLEQKRLKNRLQLTRSAPSLLSATASLDQLSSGDDDSDSLSSDCMLSESNPFEPSYYCDIDIDMSPTAQTADNNDNDNNNDDNNDSDNDETNRSSSSPSSAVSSFGPVASSVLSPSLPLPPSAPVKSLSSGHFRQHRDRRLSHSLTRIEKKIKKLNSRRRRIEEKIRTSSELYSAISLA